MNRLNPLLRLSYILHIFYQSCYILRPQLLLLFALKWQDDQSDLRYKRLLHLASQLKASQGLCVVVAFLCGNPFDETDQNNADEVSYDLIAFFYLSLFFTNLNSLHQHFNIFIHQKIFVF